MAIKTTNEGNIFTDINITPLTDIFLVLLIIMMVVAPMFQSVDKNIKMPEINNGVSVNDKEVTVAVTKGANFFVNGKPASADSLVETLTSLLSVAKDKKVVLQADAMTKNKDIMKVLKAAQEAGYEKLTVAGQPLTQKQQNTLEQQPLNTQNSDDFIP